MLIKFSSGTDKGRVRERNEDNHIVYDCSGGKVFAVADGMGGMDFGDVASLTAMECIKQELSECEEKQFDKNDAKKLFTRIFNLINNEIIKKCIEKESVTGMGTTLSMCLVTEDKLLTAHMGDSRIYIIREGKAVQVTKDHSYVEELIDSGRITREQAKIHPNRNIITRALGLDRDIEVDTDSFDLLKGDYVLLCSDGLTNAVEDEEIALLAGKSTDTDDTVKKLIDLANDRGGRDNITVQLIYKEA
jgi:protein phosphatase